MIEDFIVSEVRLARLDATDTATIKGQYQGIVNDHVIVLNGSSLQALDRSGTLTKLGQLAVASGLGPRTVVLSPDLSQWLYAIADDSRTAQIHLGTPTSDKIIATLPSPDGNLSYRPIAWNATGIYMIKEATGLGGAGPFLEYHFLLAKFDVSSGRVTDVSPNCVVYQVLDDGTMICGQLSQGKIEIRSPSGEANVIQVATGGAGTNGLFMDVAVSPDNKRLVAGRNGSQDPVLNYQMAIADLSSSGATAFGALDYLPAAWLPDGRVIANHTCAYDGWGGGPCDASLDGTYFFSADGASHSLFFKLTHGAVVGYL